MGGGGVECLYTRFMGWESQTAGLSYLSETMAAIKAHELSC